MDTSIIALYFAYGVCFAYLWFDFSNELFKPQTKIGQAILFVGWIVFWAPAFITIILCLFVLFPFLDFLESFDEDQF